METQVNNPLVIRCEYCGGDQSFDINKQKYVCAHCGAEASNAEKNAEYRHWKSLRQANFMQNSDKVKSFACPTCGAHTLASNEDASAQCPFCQNTMIDAKFSGTEAPELIIPFKITKEEAEKKLRDWISANKRNSVAQAIEKNLHRFSGCYLPYHIVRGGLNGSMNIANQAGINCSYPFHAYLKHTAVNASKDWDNLFLDGIEPFDFNDAREFDFRYLIHQKAKIQNVEPDGLAYRIKEETNRELYETLSKKVRTKEVEVILSGEDNETLLAALPVYLVKCKNGIAAAVNGQTGKISIATGKKKNLTKWWWIFPTLATLIVGAIAGLWGSMALGLGIGAVFGLVFFVVAHNRHHDEIISEVITVPKSDKSHNDTKAEFFADFGNGPTPVQIKFFTPWRTIKTILIMLAVIFLPVIIAIPIQILRGGNIADIQIGYGAAWYCIPGFFAILAGGGLAKAMMYGAPLYYETLPNEKTILRKHPQQKTTEKTEKPKTSAQGKTTPQGILANSKELLHSKMGCLVIGFLVFLLLGSVLAMLPGIVD